MGTACLFDLSPWLPLPCILCVSGTEAVSQTADGNREQGCMSWRGAGSDHALAATGAEEPSKVIHTELSHDCFTACSTLLQNTVACNVSVP